MIKNYFTNRLYPTTHLGLYYPKYRYHLGFSNYCSSLTLNSARLFVSLLLLFIVNTAVAIHPLEPADTSSPRATIESFLAITEEISNHYIAYRDSPNPATQKALEKSQAKGQRLLDLSQVASTARHEVAEHTFVLLWEVIARLELPQLKDIPDRSFYSKDDKQEAIYWRIPHTDIMIQRVEKGPEKGEFLFSPNTIKRIPSFYESIYEQPYLRPMPTENLFRTDQLITGWMIPMTWVEALPDWAKNPVYGQVIWKWLALLILMAVSLLLGIVVFRWSRSKALDTTLLSYLRFMAAPITFLILIPLLSYIIRQQINVTGAAAGAPDYILDLVFGFAIVWAIWLTSKWSADVIISLPSIKERSLDAHILRLSARIVGILAMIVFIFHVADSLGLPVYALVAGAGVGGIAIALAAKSSLENFIGTLNLYADRPVRVGDLCRYDDESESGWHPIGRIEEIGLRSTKIRRIDRTLITIPNADFSQRHIVNMQTCDRFLLNTTLGLRYETTDDQLRFLLIELRELMHAHPKTIHSIGDPVRVRFCGFGDYSLNVCIRVYIRTTDYNEFLAIQEDLLLRIMNVVKKAGTGFAFPSQTLYYARDGGLDNEQQKNAEKQVREWASAQTLGFPDFEEKYRQQITDTLDYPPEGSPGAD